MARYLYLPRLRDEDVLFAGIRDGLQCITWQSDTFAYAEAFVSRLAELLRPEVNVEFSVKVVVAVSLVLLLRVGLRGRTRRRRRSARSSARY